MEDQCVSVDEGNLRLTVVVGYSSSIRPVQLENGLPFVSMSPLYVEK
jgi:hypothetical protein